MSEQDNKLREFKRELAELLNKYDAYIGVNVLYGGFYEAYVYLDGDGIVMGKEHLLKKDYEIGAKDLD